MTNRSAWVSGTCSGGDIALTNRDQLDRVAPFAGKNICSIWSDEGRAMLSDFMSLMPVVIEKYIRRWGNYRRPHSNSSWTLTCLCRIERRDQMLEAVARLGRGALRRKWSDGERPNGNFETTGTIGHLVSHFVPQCGGGSTFKANYFRWTFASTYSRDNVFVLRNSIMYLYWKFVWKNIKRSLALPLYWRMARKQSQIFQTGQAWLYEFWPRNGSHLRTFRRYGCCQIMCGLRTGLVGRAWSSGVNTVSIRGAREAREISSGDTSNVYRELPFCTSMIFSAWVSVIVSFGISLSSISWEKIPTRRDCIKSWFLVIPEK